jgi:hypothetical protein
LSDTFAGDLNATKEKLLASVFILECSERAKIATDHAADDVLHQIHATPERLLREGKTSAADRKFGDGGFYVTNLNANLLMVFKMEDRTVIVDDILDHRRYS